MANLLIIDDTAAHRTAIKRAVEPARVFERVIEATDGLKGLRMLLSESVDAVVCDLELPGLDGEKLLRVKQASPQSRDIPFVFLTASQDPARNARLLENGASDLVAKPFHPADLLARLRLHLKIKRLQDELQSKNDTLARLSTTDPLTGLRTRLFTNEVLSIEFLRARRYATPLCVLMADLDHFKLVNDTYGHQGGDRVLSGVSDLLRSQLRATDVAGRYGGEEMLVILSQSDVDGAATLAERWRSGVEAASFQAPDGRSIKVQVSIGVGAYESGLESPDELVGIADAALYRAKEAGRNQIKVGEPR